LPLFPVRFALHLIRLFANNIAEELNKNARLKACSKCGHTLDVLSPFAGSSSNSATKVFSRIGKGMSELAFGPDLA